MDHICVFIKVSPEKTGNLGQDVMYLSQDGQWEWVENLYNDGYECCGISIDFSDWTGLMMLKNKDR